MTEICDKIYDPAKCEIRSATLFFNAEKVRQRTDHLQTDNTKVDNNVMNKALFKKSSASCLIVDEK